jgi:hypothetical protein
MGLAMLHHGELGGTVACSQMNMVSVAILEFTSRLSASIMAAKGDVDMVDATTTSPDTNDYADLLQTNHSDAFAFSEAEKLALHLYDQLKELELQQSLLQAQQSGTSHC